jgi:hypothetical protein
MVGLAPEIFQTIQRWLMPREHHLLLAQLLELVALLLELLAQQMYELHG